MTTSPLDQNSSALNSAVSLPTPPTLVDTVKIIELKKVITVVKQALDQLTPLPITSITKDTVKDLTTKLVQHLSFLKDEYLTEIATLKEKIKKEPDFDVKTNLLAQLKEKEIGVAETGEQLTTLNGNKRSWTNRIRNYVFGSLSSSQKIEVKGFENKIKVLNEQSDAAYNGGNVSVYNEKKAELIKLKESLQFLTGGRIDLIQTLFDTATDSLSKAKRRAPKPLPPVIVVTPAISQETSAASPSSNKCDSLAKKTFNVISHPISSASSVISWIWNQKPFGKKASSEDDSREDTTALANAASASAEALSSDEQQTAVDSSTSQETTETAQVVSPEQAAKAESIRLFEAIPDILHVEPGQTPEQRLVANEATRKIQMKFLKDATKGTLGLFGFIATGIKLRMKAGAILDSTNFLKSLSNTLSDKNYRDIFRGFYQSIKNGEGGFIANKIWNGTNNNGIYSTMGEALEKLIKSEPDKVDSYISGFCESIKLKNISEFKTLLADLKTNMDTENSNESRKKIISFIFENCYPDDPVS